MLYLLLALALVVGVAVYLMKKGQIKDSDGDLIPDVIEDKVEDVKEVVEETKKRVKRVKEEFDDVVEEVREVVEQVGDIPAAVKGKPRRGRKPAAKKASGNSRKPKAKSDSQQGNKK